MNKREAKMKRRSIVGAVLAAAILVPGSALLAQEGKPLQAQEQMQTQEQAREQVYGWELMTEEERLQHREKMRTMTTEEERNRYRQEHHEKMQERAKQQGVELPAGPMPHGKGMGPMGPGPKGGGKY